MKLSICIPNYNKPECLNNCLNSILKASENIQFEFEICISDNCSDSNIKEVIKPYEKFLNINFNKNDKNLGLGANILKVVEMAKGKFVWIIGNDDLLLPFALQKIDSLIQTNKDVDFFYINSYYAINFLRLFLFLIKNHHHHTINHLSFYYKIHLFYLMLF